MTWVAAGVGVASIATGAYEDGQAQKAQKGAIAPTQAAQGALYTAAEGIAATPYTAYDGEQTAGISANQQRAIQKAASDPTNDGSAADFEKAGGQADYIAGNQWNAGTAAKYMNPYTDDVTNVALAAEQRNYQGAVNNANSNAASSGAFGGDRATLYNAGLAGENELAQGTTSAQLHDAAYKNAQGAWEADNTRARNAGDLYNASGNSIVGASNSEIANLDATGGVQQQTQQAKDSAGYNTYLDKRNYAANQLAPLEAAVGKNVYANPAPTNYASAALGAAATAAGAYGKTKTAPTPDIYAGQDPEMFGGGTAANTQPIDHTGEGTAGDGDYGFGAPPPDMSGVDYSGADPAMFGGGPY